MNDVLTTVRSCGLCRASLPLAPKPILQFDPHARILVTGQAPGIRAHTSGIPFDDPSGDRLRAWMGIEKTDFYDPKLLALIPMAFCYPGTGSSGDLPPSKECARTWRNLLVESMSNLQLTILCGKYAVAWHLRDRMQSNLTKTIQNWQAYGPNLMVLPHPSGRNNGWLAKNPWFTQNLIPELRKRVKSTLGR